MGNGASQIGTSTPYPILKAPSIYYPSVVNYKPSDEAYDDSEANRKKGLKLTHMGGTGTDAGKLSVTIQMGQIGDNDKVPYGAPSGAGLKSGFNGTIKLTITDKDYDHFNFNYGKVQLPYYNDYCTKTTQEIVWLPAGRLSVSPVEQQAVTTLAMMLHILTEC